MQKRKLVLSLPSIFKLINMSKVCEVTGKKSMSGHKVSHSNIKSNRRFMPNLQKKRFFIPEENRWIELKISTSAIRTINKKGISAVLKEMKDNGVSV